VIIGGGIQGLWLLADLLDRGYHAILLERMQPGFGQTGHSHVFLHEGHMYASMRNKQPDDIVNRVAAVLEANRLWKTALNTGRLASLPQLKTDFYVGLISLERAKTFREHCRRANIPCDDSTPPTEFGVLAEMEKFYKSEGVCLESRSLLDQLLNYGDLRKRASYCNEISLEAYDSGRFNLVVKRPSDKSLSILDRSLQIRASALVLSAGAGNEKLLNPALAKAGINMDPDATRQQTVKTFMLVVRDLTGLLKPAAGLFPEFGGIFIASRQDAQGRTVLLIADGHRSPVPCPGEMTALDAATWFGRLKIDLKKLLPTILDNPGDYEWGIYEATKAEPWTPSNRFPSGGELPGSFSKSRHPDIPLWVTWPTLLTFAPKVASQITKELMETVSPATSILDWNAWDNFCESLTPSDCRWKTTPLLSWNDFLRCFVSS
jgi:glycine/D-amino acid oxidase-like deaminating enzyme